MQKAYIEAIEFWNKESACSQVLVKIDSIAMKGAVLHPK